MAWQFEPPASTKLPRLLLAAMLARAALAAPHPSNMHTVFLADCSAYFHWQSLGMFYSHAKSGQPGPITRVMCCEDAAVRNLPQVRFRSALAVLVACARAPSRNIATPPPAAGVA